MLCPQRVKTSQWEMEAQGGCRCKFSLTYTYKGSRKGEVKDNKKKCRCKIMVAFLTKINDLTSMKEYY